MGAKVGISGMGRIGRLTLRAAWGDPAIDVVAVNATTDARTLAHLLKYDSVQGRWGAEIDVDGDDLVIDGRRIRVVSDRDPARLPWGDLGVDVVLEATGKFTTREAAAAHLTAGAKKVIITTAAKSDDLMIVYGVNHEQYDPARHHVISSSSCTTNCLAPIVAVLHERFGIVEGAMTTVHSFTNDQRSLDNPHKDLRRARAASQSIVPTTTGAARAIGKIFPELQGRLNGLAIRVPTPTVSLVDLVVTVERPATVEALNEAFAEAAAGRLRGILDLSEEPLVSADYIGNPHSCVIDALSTMVIGERTVKVLGWYDNEMGFAHRMADLLRYVGARLGAVQDFASAGAGEAHHG
ncbi:type I glyceraldehyde-3-phosphate dehydrogenase [Hydrogenibacillus sp. N12]|uniref:type I glyceraldehyde-3-phosphate dehydrogenase n=1 Tax=Hydrogenibacillus sp. N12 TaxID=2866627 RepID=UPI001C7CCF00|nr:type I glyceraldehyde-3-phosphate dehydrogenase [Hydrogenibacillus sp. N12]QZA33544.1 type I glyceraldehyde-3-phosphate dehydrogenase [Hydrogenibacillus sp. N12]